MSNSHEKGGNAQKGVLLLNLGGPETIADVRPFLYNLFSDPEIIRIRSRYLRKLLAWLITAVRQHRSRDLYNQIGGGSPLRVITEKQAAALSAKLASGNLPARVYVGMRCWKPTIDEAVGRIRSDGIGQLVLLPLFPQYSRTTSGSCLSYFKHLHDKLGLSSELQTIYTGAWFDEPLYVESMADLIREGMRRFSDGNHQDVLLLYSAHSIPVRYVAEGDPYLEQTQKSVELINSRLGNAYSSKLSFQSKIGPVKWLGPSTKDVLAELGQAGAARVLVVPISFVSDHIETLQEIDISYKTLAARAGIKEFHRADSLNLYPKFIDALANVVLNACSSRGVVSREEHQDK